MQVSGDERSVIDQYEEEGNNMKYSKEHLNKLVEDLKRQRDELNVRLHLAKADARDEWAKLETKYDEVKAKMDLVRKEAGKTAESVGAALGLAIDEMKKGYERLRKMM